ncbi:hypothetical protein IV454_30880 [Massilia antarctica]|uniref:Uncharacterized protein n=1 Tax=Massilia antarctica TaxID=2765360 RepID=A0AA49A7T4_9BURK|nr:hypothetical protein [Massilia antarctica]QPI49773.1 hypothetical protein IV454_30880 [Massilia antarctica]
MRRSLLCFAGVLLVAGAARASSCSYEHIDWARTSATGEIVVGASFGTLRSLDGGKTWLDADAEEAGHPAPVATAPQESFVHTDADGVQYATRADRRRRHLVRKAGKGARWTRLPLRFDAADAPSSAVLVGGNGRTLYFIGGADSYGWPVLPVALYRATAGKAEKLADLDQSVREGAYPFFLAGDGSMAYAGPNQLWVSFAAGAGWTRIEGQSLTSRPWRTCYKVSM